MLSIVISKVNSLFLKSIVTYWKNFNNNLPYGECTGLEYCSHRERWLWEGSYFAINYVFTSLPLIPQTKWCWIYVTLDLQLFLINVISNKTKCWALSNFPRGKDLLFKILNCRFGLKIVGIFELFCQNEKFLNLNNHTNFKSMTIALKLFVNPQF